VSTVLTEDQILDLLRARFPGEESRILAKIGAQALLLRMQLADNGGDMIGVTPPAGYISETLNLILSEMALQIAASGGGGTTDHGLLTGLGDDDHPQYFNQARGDARYPLIGHTHTIANVTGLQAALDAKIDDSQVSAFALTLLDDADAGAARTTLGLGTAATQPSSAFEPSGAVSAHTSAPDPHPQYLTAAEANALYALISHTHVASQISDSTAAGRSLLTAVDAAAQRSALGLGSSATTSSGAYVANASAGTNAISMSWLGSGNIRATIDSTNFTLWSSGNSAQVLSGTVTGQIARWNQTNGRYESFDLLGTANTWGAQQTFSTTPLIRSGTVDTQVISLSFGWAGGNQRWAQVLEADGDFSLWSYDSAGGNASQRLRLDNAVGGASLFVGASTLTYGGNSVWHTGTLGSIVNGGNNNSYTETSAPLLRNWNGTNAPGGFYEVVHFPGAATAHALQIAYLGGDAQNYFIRHYNDQNGWAGTSATWRQIWHSGNSAQVQVGTSEGQRLVWNQGAGRYDAAFAALSTTDWNNTIASGVWMGFSAANAPIGGWLIGVVTAHNDLWVTQEVYDFTNSNPGERVVWRRQSTDGGGRVWSAWTRRSQLFGDSSFDPTTSAVVNSAVTSTGSFGGGYIQRDGSVYTGVWTVSDGTIRWGIGGSGGLTQYGMLTTTGWEDARGNVRHTPVNIQNGNYTFTTNDFGRKVMKTSTSAVNYTIPGSFAVGATIVIRNRSSTGNISVIRGSGVTLLRAGVATNADATIAPWGEAVLHCENVDEWVISGTGVS